MAQRTEPRPDAPEAPGHPADDADDLPFAVVVERAGWYFQTFGTMIENLLADHSPSKLLAEYDALAAQLSKVEKRLKGLAPLKGRVAALEEQYAQLEGLVGALLDGIDAKLDGIDAKLAAIQAESA